jgi:hypothetical protein
LSARSPPCHDPAARDRFAVAGGEQRLERIDGRAMGAAVNKVATEMALKRGDDRDGRFFVNPGRLDPEALARERALQVGDRLAAIAERERRRCRRRLRDIHADAGAVQAFQGKLLAGIDLAARRDVGMASTRWAAVQVRIRWFTVAQRSVRAPSLAFSTPADQR